MEDDWDTFTIPMKATIPLGDMRCPVCDANPQEGVLIGYAREGLVEGAILETGTEMMSFKFFCAEHAPEETP